jgi:hypothetical protein
MKLLTFSSYDEYKRVQVAANKLKYHNVYAEDPELRRIAADFKSRVKHARAGLCHGVRNGYEVRKLRQLLPAVNIVGTDISETAATIPNCIVWDMHELKPEWINRIDFIYSNSWDHTYDPEMMFARWSKCLSEKGRLYLPYTNLQSEVGVTDNTKIDVFGCSIDELLDILRKSFVVDDVLEVRPRLTAQVFRRRFAHLRAGEIMKSLTARIISRRILIFVLRRKNPVDAHPER